MLVPQLHAAHPPATPAVRTAAKVAFNVEGDQVQNGLSLYLPLKNRTQMPALLQLIQVNVEVVHEALTRLHYVHFARFLPSPDGSALWVITEFDGGLQSYVMDFVAVLGDVFTAMLQFVADAPPLPVRQHAREFTEFVVSHNVARAGIWSAYPQVTVIDILRSTKYL